MTGPRMIGSGVWPSAELFDQATGAWSPVGALKGGRLGHSAPLLQDGRVLVVGGAGCPGGGRVHCAWATA